MKGVMTLDAVDDHCSWSGSAVVGRWMMHQGE